MKKIILLSLATLLAAVSCGGQRNQNKESDNPKTPVSLTKTEFLKRVINYEKTPDEWKYLGDKPAIVNFYADWCGACKILAPSLEELAEEYSGQIYIYKVNTDKEPELAAAFGIESLPTLIFIPMEDEPQMAMGAIPKEYLKKAIDSVLLGKTEEAEGVEEAEETEE